MNDDTDGRLLPCPFCGSQSAAVVWRDGFPSVRCMECYCGTGEYDGGSESRPIEAWNCRATHIDAQAAEIARLREALARHGRHDARCASNTMLTSLPPKRNPCDCGFSAALAGDA